ncbi:SyrB-like regulator [Rhizobium tubonense]|uniref:SyrB-like regulator n=1 Tax=Rhizobium tubonense TaxID=484088 RepID=A0A2W4D255_9HYPH|nr:SyrB-like regulator [Rhizobium tubonense]PZM16395.1 SyrB-like regulator [Rhizobium tubonense]
MADENNTNATVEVGATNAPVSAPEPKTQRAPRRSKAEIEAALSASSATKSPKISKKRSARPEALPAASKALAAAIAAPKDGIKATGKTKVVVPAEPAAKSPVTASDEMADLIQLEEENKSLRKALADKLRAENADLRKRLGRD